MGLSEEILAICQKTMTAMPDKLAGIFPGAYQLWLDHTGVEVKISVDDYNYVYEHIAGLTKENEILEALLKSAVNLMMDRCGTDLDCDYRNGDPYYDLRRWLDEYKGCPELAEIHRKIMDKRGPETVVVEARES